MSNMIIAGKDCEKCKYGTIDDSNKAKVQVHCETKEKDYIWGQCIQCECFERKEK